MSFGVLILCTHNSARSALAQCMLSHWAQRLGRDVQAYSAGSAPSGRIHPMALAVLAEAGVATAGVHSKSWDVFCTADAPVLSLVVTVCDSAAAEACPYFPGQGGEPPVRVHWGYPDPSRAPGDEADRERAFELTRQALGYRMLQLLALPLEQLDRAALAAAVDEIAAS